MKTYYLALFTLITHSALFAQDLRIQNGSRVNFDKKIATVVRVYQNGQVLLAVEGRPGQIVKHASQLGVSIQCLWSLCVGTSALVNDKPSKVLEIFSNGNVKVAIYGELGQRIKSIHEIAY